ncbi:PROB1 protein, partial [Amia calva]|nr:PROB1 protein [Amia calva]
MSCYVFKNTGAKAEPGRDSARCFIAAPGRMHFGGKLKGKDIHEYSSGASSAVSELDDADKEVRNLTARAFRSLACPYFDAINFSTSSDSSASEHGLGINRWSTFVDLKYGNMTQSREQNMVAHKSSTSTFEINKNADAKGIRGLALGHLKAPQTKIFALNGNAAQPQTAATSSQKIELKGEFEPGQSGVITLTETLNFRCNVKAGVPESERRAKCAENVAGSRSADEVTDTLPSELGCEASKHSCNTGEAMDGTHKKAIFASSLLKNVISKKMQFEQERKMERGEISESCPGLSPCLSHKEPETQRERAAGGDSRALQRQTSRFSEAGSDFTVVSVGEIEDVTDSKPCDLKENGQKEDALTLASETNFEACGEAAVDTKKGVSDATKSTLLRSQNSAFRSWREGELEFQKEYRNDKTAAGKSSASETDKQQQGTVDGGKSTKMSHLFVPSIQLLSKELEEGKPQANKKYSTRPAADLGGGGKLGSDNTLYVPDANRSVVTSKSPEIKISLRTVKDHKHNPFNIAKLLTPNIGCKVANLIKTADDSRCQALAASLKGEPSEKVPHFMVRDIRDNKCKLQTPIHQVRDVRKLVKSSYHFVSLDGNENKAHSAGDLNAEHKPSLQGVSRNPASLSPIVIKCQSVNTNSAEKPAGDLAEGSKHRLAEDCSEAERCSPPPPAEGARNGAVLVHRTTGRVPLVSAAKQPKSDTSEVPPAVKIETRAAKRKQEKISETMDKKPESQMVNQAALEKLKAAVKTMEQLYVFDRNEWKRKTEPRPITDSHVLSLITSEEQGSGRTGMEGEEEGCSVASSAAAAGNAECLVRRNSYPNADRSPPRPSPGGLLFEASPKKEAKECLKTFHIPFGREDRPLPLPPSGASKNVFTFSNSQKAPPTAASISSKVPPPFTVSQVPFNTKSFVPKSPKAPLSLKISAARPAAAEERATVDGHSSQSPRRSSVVMETRSPDTPTATIYHHSLPLAMSGAQPQLICFSPSMPPHAPPVDHFQQTQRKMLLDPTTGHYYLVDTPVQPATKRLFDPETGQYVDIPMPQQPMTPVPMSPLALSPGAYGPTYMIYPGFLPTTTVLPARTLQSQLSSHSEADEAEKSSSKETLHMGQHGEVAYMESPYYIPTGKPTPVSQHVTARGAKGFSDGKPVISITSQQGPRIIAPPSFDGTTMSFVVEHR